MAATQRWRIPLIAQLWQAYNRFQTHDGDLLAAAVAYYAALSFFPLLLVLTSGLGLFLQFTHLGQNAEQQVLTAIGDYTSESMRADVQNLLQQVAHRAPVGGPIGLAMLVLGAAALFVQVERAFDRIWETGNGEPKGMLAAVQSVLLYRVKAFLMLGALGLVILAIFFAGMALSTVKAYLENLLPLADWTWSVVQVATSILLNSLVVAVIYRALPRASVGWLEAWKGGLLTAAVWEGGRLLLAAFLIGKSYSAYGVIGSFLALMLWVYYASSVLFLGAEYVRVTAGK